MHPRPFIDKLDDAVVATAITAAELTTSAEIRVCVSRQNRPAALEEAKAQFSRLAMESTPLRNAVLVYFSPRAQTFALWADVGVQEKCSAEFWQKLISRTASRLSSGDFTQAVTETVYDLGEMLSQHFPRTETGENGFSNTVVRD